MYTLEYSVEQDALHIDTFDNTLERNKQMAIENKTNDYKVIGIFDTYEEALENSKEFRNKRGYRSPRFTEPK